MRCSTSDARASDPHRILHPRHFTRLRRANVNAQHGEYEQFVKRFWCERCVSAVNETKVHPRALIKHHSLQYILYSQHPGPLHLLAVNLSHSVKMHMRATSAVK